MGGIVGIMRENSTINNCRIEDSVTVFSENTWIGGVAGRSRDSIISNCYVAASVSGERITGAITGESTSDTLSNNYYIQGCTTASGYPQNAVGRNNTEGETTPDVAGQNTGLANSSATHTHIDLEHKGKDATCTEDGVYTYSDCLVCGTFLSGKKGVMPAAHKYEDGTCTACGNLCDHGGAPSTVYDNKDGTHIDKYDCCDLTVYFGDHILDADGFCTTEGCGGYQPAVLNGGTYEISTSGQLYWFADKVNNGETAINAVLTQNIAVNENLLNADGTINEAGRNLLVWTPIGNQSNQFVGSFNGKGYEVSGLFLNKESGVDNVGLFGFVGTNGTVKNVGVVDTYFNARNRVGGVVGANNGGTVMNCYNIGIVSGRDYVGGVVGTNVGTVTNCYYLTGTSTGGINKADVAGQAEAKTIEQFASGEVAYLLGSAFGQKLGENGDKYPVAAAPDNSNKVYYGYLSCADEGMVYTNNSSASSTKPEHTLVYTASGSTITATCSADCDFTATATISAENTTYDGTAKTATVTYSDGWVGGNVTLTYENNVNAGTATASITLSDITASVTFTIEKATVTVTANAQTKSYGEADPTLTYSVSGLIGSDTLSGELKRVAGESLGNYAIEQNTLSADDNYTIYYVGADLTIEARAIAGSEVTISMTEAIYNGTKQKPEITVVVGGETLVPDKDYTFSWDKNDFVNADTYTVTITGIGNYQGTVNKSYQITPKPLIDSDISIDITEATYNGNAHIPVITVKDGEKNLLDETDYEISWNKNGFVNADTYTATITGKGNYSGSFTRTLVINKAEIEIELSSPIPSVLPGNQIALMLNTNSESTPTWTITGGAHVSGAIIKIDDSLVIGQDQVTITVTYDESTNIKSGSKTITLEVGMADFSGEIADLEEKINDLGETYATDAELKTELDALKDAINALKATDVTNAEAISDINEKIESIKNTYAVKADLDAAVKRLDELTKTGGTIDQINEEIQKINKALNDLDAENRLDAAEDALNTLVTTTIPAIDKLISENSTAIGTNTSEIATLKTAIDGIQTTIADLNTEDKRLAGLISGLDTELEGLVDSLDALTDRVDAAEKDIAQLKQDLADAIDKLNKDIADGDKVNADAIAKAIEDLNKLIESAEKQASDADAALKTELKKAIKDAQTAITAAYEKAIADAVEKLEGADKANSEALAKAIEDLEALIDAAEEAAIEGDNTLSGKIVEAIAKAEDELKTAKESLEALIGGVQSNLDKAKTELDKAIADLDAAMKKGDADLSAEITNLNTALTDAKTALEKTDADNKAELVKKIEDADATLDAAIEKVQKNLDDAKAALEKALADGDKANADALAQAISDLNAAIDAAETAAVTADGSLKSELTSKIDNADAALEAAIEALAGELDTVKNALEARDNELQTFIIIVCVISGVALCGSGAFVVWFFIDRKKRI